jgi:ribose transport system substrate-binding protein
MRSARTLTAIAGAGLVLALGGCGSGDEETASGAAAGGATSEQAGGGERAYFEQGLETLYKGTHEAPPTESPKPAPGRNVWLISCGESAATCATVMQAAKEAAGLLGWKATIFDSKGDPSVAATGIRQAIAAKADGIYVYYQDCGYLKQPLLDAKKANIPVVASESFDCDYEKPGEEPLYADTTDYVQGSNEAWAKAYGAAQAIHLIAKTGPKTNALLFQDDTTALGKPLKAGFAAEFEKCEGCSFKEVTFPFTAIGTDLQERAEQALLQNPEVNAVAVEYDSIFDLGVSAAAKASGRDISAVTGEGGATAVEAVRKGDAIGGSGDPNMWGGWHAMDSLNRIFNGEEPAESGIGIQAYDKDHGMPEGDGPFKPTVDYEAAYRKAWGVE